MAEVVELNRADVEPRQRVYEFRASHKADGKGRTRVAGYASVWGSLNSFGEIFVPGAFTDTLARKSDEKPLTMLWQHREPIGRWEIPPSTEDERGLYLEGPISKTRTGQDAEVLLRDGAVTGLSIGFVPEVWAFAEPGEHVTFDTPFGPRSFKVDEWVVYVLKADLLETSLVFAPSDDEARLTEVRSKLAKAERALPALRAGASWEDAAYSMALLMGGRGAAAFVDLPDVEHRKLFARIAEAYAKFDREAPAYVRHPTFSKVEFRHDEREVFHDRYLRKTLDSVVAGAAGVEGALSRETRSTAEKAVSLLTDLLARKSEQEQLAEIAALLSTAADAVVRKD